MNSKILGLLAVGLLAGPTANAVPAYFTNEAAFNAAAGGAASSVQSFESAPGGSATSLDFGNVTVGCSGTPYCPSFFGRRTGFATDGSYSAYFATPSSITFTFVGGINAFAIDVIGLGTSGVTTLSVSLDGGAAVAFFSNVTGGSLDARFAGIFDAGAVFSTVTFTGTAPDDGIDFDRLRFGASSSVPEPGTFALLGLGLLGLGFTRRKA